MFRIRIVVLLLCLVGSVSLVGAQTAVGVITAAPSLNVRTNPGAGDNIIGQVNYGSEVVIEGRNADASWLLINDQARGVRGWIAGQFIVFPIDLEITDFPVSTEVLSLVGRQAPPAQADAPLPPVTLPDQAAIEEAPPAPAIVAPAAPIAGTLTDIEAEVVAGPLRVRNNPGTDSAIIGSLNAGNRVLVNTRNDLGDWVYIISQDNNAQGWVSSQFLDFADGFFLGDLLVHPGFAAPAPVVPAPAVDVVAPEAPTVNTDAVLPTTADLEARLLAYPVLPTVTNRTREIWERGRAIGHFPNRFTKVGDSNTRSISYLYGYDVGNYDLGSFAYLQPTVAFFSGSFSHESLAGQVGFNAVTAGDALFAEPGVCEPNEAPVFCEYRTYQASFALVMFGANDISTLTDAQYEDALRKIIDLSIQAGTVPLLSTFTTNPQFPDRWERALQLNLITARLASEYDVPLINFWAAVKDLPNAGMSADNTHLTANMGARIDLNGDQNVSGFGMWNLVALQSLDIMRQGLGL